MANIGLFGGAFDPIHRGHVAVACQALQVLRLDEVRLMPLAAPVHKSACQASPWQRTAMVALAIQGIPGLRLEVCELERHTPSYAIDTLEQLSHQHGEQHQWSWILGADALLGFKQWRRWQDIVKQVNLIVVDRPGSDLDAVDGLAKELSVYLHSHGRVLHRLSLPPQPQASHLIRKHGATLDDLPDLVCHYIEAEGLYL